MRRGLALLTLACCGAAAGTAHAVALPRYQLLGDWSFHGERFRFTARGGHVSGRTLTALRLGHCRIARGSVIFSGYSFAGAQGGTDYWRGRLALVKEKGCRRRFVASRISLRSDVHFAESSKLPGARRPRTSTFTRIRPPVSDSDPVLGTWLRNGAAVVVSRSGGMYLGRAREAFKIANGCTVPSGTVVWRLRPLAPDRYSGTIQAFHGPPGCAPAAGFPSVWRFGASHSQLLRESAGGPPLPYTRG